MTRLLHLNGPPGIGKSTLAGRYVGEHPGVLNCDIDVLRTLVGGWMDDFVGAGRRIRDSALAMITAYLRHDDVVLPQMLIDPAQLAAFETAARAADAEFVEVFLVDAEDAAVARFWNRGAGAADPWHDQVRAIVTEQGGDDVLRANHRGLAALSESRPGARMLLSVVGDEEGTYARLLDLLG